MYPRCVVALACTEQDLPHPAPLARGRRCAGGGQQNAASQLGHAARGWEANYLAFGLRRMLLRFYAVGSGRTPGTGSAL